MKLRPSWVLLACLILMGGCVSHSQTESTPTPTLDGTTWQLVRFEGGDGAVLTPDDRSKYTLAFEPSGKVAARIDCNRGSGGWQSAAPGQLELGPLALTRAMCPQPELHDHIVKQWPYIRSYVIRDSRLYLSLMADGGIYEFEPAGAQ